MADEQDRAAIRSAQREIENVGLLSDFSESEESVTA
jgi:hypothetical protein